MVCKNNKNSKKKINNLKAVIKITYKKKNKNTKKIGGGLGVWSGLKSLSSDVKSLAGDVKEGAIKGFGRYKGKGVKKLDGSIKFFTRQERGLSRFKIGRNYRSGKQMEDRVNYMTHRINEKKNRLTKVQDKLSGFHNKFNMKVSNTLEKLEIETAQDIAKFEKQLSKGKINQAQFDEKIKGLQTKKDNVISGFEKSKKKFLRKNRRLIEKIERKKKSLIKISDKYAPHIKKLHLKLRTKARKSTKLLNKGLYRTCKKLPPGSGCSDALKKCRQNPRNFIKAEMVSCMSGVPGFNVDLLNKKILKTKWYTNPSHRRKIKARSKRIDRLHETEKVMINSKAGLKYASNLQDQEAKILTKMKEAQAEAQKYKNSAIYSNQSRGLFKETLEEIEKKEQAAILKKGQYAVSQDMNETIQVAKAKISASELERQGIATEKKQAEEQLISNAQQVRQEEEQAAKIISEAKIAESQAKSQVEAEAKKASNALQKTQTEIKAAQTEIKAAEKEIEETATKLRIETSKKASPSNGLQKQLTDKQIALGKKVAVKEAKEAEEQTAKKAILQVKNKLAQSQATAAKGATQSVEATAAEKLTKEAQSTPLQIGKSKSYSYSSSIVSTV